MDKKVLGRSNLPLESASNTDSDCCKISKSAKINNTPSVDPWNTDLGKSCCFDQWPIEQCETAKQSGECGESQIANNCLKTCGWCCDIVDDIVDPGKKI